MKDYKAKYQIIETFSLTGRGLVLAGTILEGLISKGDFIVFNFKGKSIKRKISGIEGIRSAKGIPNTGIVIECNDEKEILDLRAWKPNNVITVIL